jgi:catechol 2,3-dioxygenase-like lactoylglutathione lyase family enzyme
MAAATPARLRTIDHGTIPTNDLNALERFYVDLLGMRIDNRPNMTTDFFRKGIAPGIFAGFGTSELGLFLESKYDLPPTEGTRGLPRFGLEVASDDFAPVVEAIRSAGVEIEGPVDEPEPGVLRTVYFRDPAGNYVEVVDRGAIKNPAVPKFDWRRVDHVEYDTPHFDETVMLWREALGMEVFVSDRSPDGEGRMAHISFPETGQWVRYHEVAEFRPRSTKEWRGIHWAYGTTTDDYREIRKKFDAMGVTNGHFRGDKDHGDLREVLETHGRAEPGVYFWDPNEKKLEVTPKDPPPVYRYP